MRSLFRLGALLAIAVSPARAVDLSDTWIGRDDAGARAVLVQTGDVLALDLFREASIDGAAHLHAAALPMIGRDARGERVFAGSVGDGQVGIVVSSPDSATISVELDLPQGRQRLLLDRGIAPDSDLGGHFQGGYSQSGAHCAAFSGPRRDRAGVWTLGYPDAVDPLRISLRFESADGSQTCRFDGQQVDLGRIARIAGRYACTGGVDGRFAIDPLEHGDDAFSGRMTLDSAACGVMRLRLGGLRLR